MKVYCNKCRHYKFYRFMGNHCCEHPKWLIDKKAVTVGTAIHPPSTYKLWHHNRDKPSELNRNNDCELYEKRRWWQ